MVFSGRSWQIWACPKGQDLQWALGDFPWPEGVQMGTAGGNVQFEAWAKPWAGVGVALD